MSEALMKSAIAGAMVAADSMQNPTSSQVAEVAANMPPPMAMESLWPQLARYAITAVGSALAAHGVIGTETAPGIISPTDWQVIAGVIMAVGPVIYRVVRVLVARSNFKL